MARDEFDLDAQEETQRKAAEKAKLHASIEKGDILWLMSQKRGRRIVYNLLADAGVWKISFNTNALQMAFNEGTRNYGLMLLDKVMRYCPEQYTQMIRENTEDD